MERLTINKNVSEMGMFELAHNSSYTKDEKVRYRDYDTDIDARELAIKLLDKFADIPNEFTCDDDFDDFIVDSIQYGTDDIIGLIAIFYRNLWAMSDLRERLKEYEDLEEQGKLLKLPCAVGDTVYRICPKCNSEHKNGCKNCAWEHSCSNNGCSVYGLWKDGQYPADQCTIVPYKVTWNYIPNLLEHIGKTVFLTQERAEAVLREIVGIIE